MTVYNRAAFDAALTKFGEAPKSLTDDDVAQLGLVSPELADQARAKRRGLVPAETAAERKLLDRPATFRDVLGTLEDHLFPVLAAQRFERDQLEARVAALSGNLETAAKAIGRLQAALEDQQTATSLLLSQRAAELAAKR